MRIKEFSQVAVCASTNGYALIKLFPRSNQLSTHLDPKPPVNIGLQHILLQF